ncbi:hypothetical protein A79_2019 [Vibrio parahaemolyticus AQ3810]|nr:hypothetical protein A79_2019 [Vibrio parahaemolyticus AQ3810]EXJ45578.1 hypothetical protein D049_1671 [Vibrio parahaemolyticus VPTS-2010]
MAIEDALWCENSQHLIKYDFCKLRLLAYAKNVIGICHNLGVT